MAQEEDTMRSCPRTQTVDWLRGSAASHPHICVPEASSRETHLRPPPICNHIVGVRCCCTRSVQLFPTRSTTSGDSLIQLSSYLLNQNPVVEGAPGSPRGSGQLQGHDYLVFTLSQDSLQQRRHPYTTTVLVYICLGAQDSW
jgi:hypothetical protein